MREKWKSWAGAAAKRPEPTTKPDVTLYRLTSRSHTHVQMYLSTMEDVFKQESVMELKGRVQRAKQVVITAHRRTETPLAPPGCNTFFRAWTCRLKLSCRMATLIS